DLVRVYAGSDPAVMTLQSDLMIPPNAFDQMSECVLSDLAPEFDRAIFLAGAPARNEEEIGEVIGIATDDRMESEVGDAGIELAEGSGLVGGVTGALVDACYERGVPAVVLVVKAHPQLPDPGAARSVIENAIEPLVDFDVDTTELQEQSDQIQAQLEQIAQQYRQMTQEGQGQAQPATPSPSMYQ
ncbi:MAG TPA: PAC2 family protein, partial [Halobacteriales archaeon]|nr:PAC2 family protein [Halobacteriales archaeon]